MELRKFVGLILLYSIGIVTCEQDGAYSHTTLPKGKTNFFSGTVSCKGSHTQRANQLQKHVVYVSKVIRDILQSSMLKACEAHCVWLLSLVISFLKLTLWQKKC